MRRTFALAAVLLVLAAAPAPAMTFNLYQLTDGWTSIDMVGEIHNGDAARFAAFLRGHPTTIFRMNSPGGAVLEAVKIGTQINSVAGSETAVPNGSTCTSACFWLWAAGHQRRVGSTASIGVHSPAEPDGSEDGVSASLNVSSLRWSQRSLARYRISTPATTGRWMW
jgi:hypothetical protein